jgi:hypothetical protein
MSTFIAQNSVFNNVAGDQYNIFYIVLVVQAFPAPPQRRSVRRRFADLARRLLHTYRQ